jgi:diguanylate cyclase (GGDEF)-like protein
MKRALHRAGRNANRVALLFIDLDAFKDVNDSAGHLAGDQALVELGTRIRRVVRADAVVARIGGDEFALLLEDLDDAGQATAVADRLLAAIDRPLVIAGVERRIGASIGIALSSDDLAEAPDLLAAADRAMYEAKRAGGGRHAVFEGRLSGPAVA